jgi:hypothetical protein
MFVEGVFFGQVLDSHFKLLKMFLSCYQNHRNEKVIKNNLFVNFKVIRVTKPTTKSYFLN